MAASRAIGQVNFRRGCLDTETCLPNLIAIGGVDDYTQGVPFASLRRPSGSSVLRFFPDGFSCATDKIWVVPVELRPDSHPIAENEPLLRLRSPTSSVSGRKVETN